MVSELPYVVLVAGGVIVSLYIANIAFDYRIPQYISRKVGHLGGCVGFLLCPLLFTSFVWPLVLTVGFTGLLLYARWRRPSTFRGVGGSGRPDALAEIHFPATGIVLIGVLWGIYDLPWLAIVPLTFMGGGDAMTGLIRSKVYNREVKGPWGSLGMIITCLLLAVFIEPYWIGAIGAVVATAAEKFTKTTSFWDDNASIPLSSAAVMAAFYFLGGQA